MCSLSISQNRDLGQRIAGLIDGELSSRSFPTAKREQLESVRDRAPTQLLTFEDLATISTVLHKRDFTPAIVACFIDGPGFFEKFLPAAGASWNPLKQYLKESGGFTKKALGESAWAHLQDYVSNCYPNLDTVRINSALAYMLSAESTNSPRTLAATLVRAELIDPVAPPDHTFKVLHADSNTYSYYLDREIVSADALPQNIKTYLRARKINSLDDLSDGDMNLYRAALGGADKFGILKLAALLVKQGYMSAEIPADYDLEKGVGHSLYFDPILFSSPVLYPNPEVGQAALLNNLKTYCCKRYPTIDDLRMDEGLGNRLKLRPDFSTLELVQTVFAPGGLEWYPSVRPTGYSLVRSGGPGSVSRYALPEVLGEELARANIESYAREMVPHLDVDVRNFCAPLAGMIGLHYASRAQRTIPVLSRLVELGWVDPVMPDNHPLSRNFSPDSDRLVATRYLDHQIVGKEAARRNALKILDEWFLAPNDVPTTFPGMSKICKALGIPEVKATVVRQFLTERLELNSFRDFALAGLPKEFDARAFGAVVRSFSSSGKREISSVAVSKHDMPIGLLKAQVFEQMVGAVLATIYNSELVVPKPCIDLNLEKGTFNKRADFMIGNLVVECQWSGSAQEMSERHLRIVNCLSGNQRALLVSAEHSGENPSFNKTLEQLMAGSAIELVGTRMRASLDNIVIENNTRMGSAVRDFLYFAIDQSNRRLGGERVAFLQERLGYLVNMISEGRVEAIEAQAPYSYSESEALLSVNGRWHRYYLTPWEIARQKPHDLELAHSFVGVRFANELDRNMAVMLEFTPFLYSNHLTFEAVLDTKDHLRRGGVVREAHFVFPDGRVIAREPKLKDASPIAITRLEDFLTLGPAHSDLTVSQRDFAFVKRFIEEAQLSVQIA